MLANIIYTRNCANFWYIFFFFTVIPSSLGVNWHALHFQLRDWERLRDPRWALMIHCKVGESTYEVARMVWRMARGSAFTYMYMCICICLCMYMWVYVCLCIHPQYMCIRLHLLPVEHILSVALLALRPIRAGVRPPHPTPCRAVVAWQTRASRPELKSLN